MNLYELEPAKQTFPNVGRNVVNFLVRLRVPPLILVGHLLESPLAKVSGVHANISGDLQGANPLRLVGSPWDTRCWPCREYNRHFCYKLSAQWVPFVVVLSFFESDHGFISVISQAVGNFWPCAKSLVYSERSILGQIPNFPRKLKLNLHLQKFTYLLAFACSWTSCQAYSHWASS